MPDAEKGAPRNSWFRKEYERSKARNALTPPHARMVVTNPILSAHTRMKAPARVLPSAEPYAPTWVPIPGLPGYHPPGTRSTLLDVSNPAPAPLTTNETREDT